MSDATMAMFEDIAKLRAENERLRAALERIANFEPQDWTTRHASAALRIVPPPLQAHPCDHRHYEFAKHGRRCTCGALMLDFGD